MLRSILQICYANFMQSVAYYSCTTVILQLCYINFILMPNITTIYRKKHCNLCYLCTYNGIDDVVQWKTSAEKTFKVNHKYGTTQMQLHTRMRVLDCPHACASMCPVMSDGTLASLTYCTCVLHEGLHTHTRVALEWIHTHMILAVSPTCSRQSLRRIVSQGAYSSDIISGYS